MRKMWDEEKEIVFLKQSDTQQNINLRKQKMHQNIITSALN